MRLLRGLNYHVSGFMPKAQLLRLLRFTVDSDDQQYDPRKPPWKIGAVTIVRSMIHLFLYVYSPVTRAMMKAWLCRALDGQTQHLKDDLAYTCWEGDHRVVLVLSLLLWVPFAVLIPLGSAYFIRKSRTAALFEADGTPRDTFDDESEWLNLVTEVFHTHATTVASTETALDKTEATKRSSASSNADSEVGLSAKMEHLRRLRPGLALHQ
jgi:hypothetical protein